MLSERAGALARERAACQHRAHYTPSSDYSDPSFIPRPQVSPSDRIGLRHDQPKPRVGANRVEIAIHQRRCGILRIERDRLPQGLERIGDVPAIIIIPADANAAFQAWAQGV